MSTTHEHLQELFLRDLPKLAVEIEGYSNDEDIWKLHEGINNSAGNLCLHMCGNLQHYMGAVLLNNGYERDRDFEFNGRCDKQALLDDIDRTLTVITDTFSALSTEDLDKEYPVEMFGNKLTTGFFLIHLYGHLNYHLGQVNYHRRLI